MKNRVRRGFTLPEILVTVTVIAVLAAVIVPAVTQYVNKGDTPATQQDLNEVRSAITAYIADTRTNPTSFFDLTSPSAGGAKGPYLAASLSGVTGAGTFTSSGLGLTLGSAITYDAASGYLLTPVTLKSGVDKCSDLFALDVKLDQGTNAGGATGTATTTADAGNGLLIWTDANCASLTTPASAASPQLRLAAVGK
jgi:prepilin-type N-terminal cleavage/methylation domain-containing protein